VHFRGDSTLLEEARYNYLKKICRRILLRWVYSFVDKAWYVGLQNKNYYKKMGMKEDQLVFVPHAVDNDRFNRTDELQEKASLLKKQMNIPGDALVFLFAGQMIQRKNVFTLVNVFKQLNLPNGHLLMVGSGKELARLNELAADESNIHFVPPQSQTSMPVIYSAADVLILPSKEDTWGLVINEAMANGLAIVASDQCGAAFDLIEEGKNGYMFPYRDEERLSEIIKEFCNDPTKVKIMGQYSLKKITNFSYDVAAAAIEKLLLHN
jgi:glycosyltransferase involved in cell wall biosynthesis